MEFEEMQKIWDSQNNRTLYAIDENALGRRISAKRQAAIRTSNASELTIIITYLISGFVNLAVIILNGMHSVFMYLLAGWMFLTALYAIVIRVMRIRARNKFDRTLSGELEQAIATTNHQVRFSQILRWNIIPVVVFVVLALWDTSKSIWAIAGILAFFSLAIWASRWEHKFYRQKKEELEQLKVKLEE